MRSHSFQSRNRSWICSTKNIRISLCHAGLCTGLMGCILRRQTTHQISGYRNYWQPEGYDGEASTLMQERRSQARKISARHLRSLAPIGGLQPIEAEVA